MNIVKIVVGVLRAAMCLWTDFPQTNTITKVLSVKRKLQSRPNLVYGFAENDWYNSPEAPPLQESIEDDLQTTDFPNSDNIPKQKEVEVITVEVEVSQGITGKIEFIPVGDSGLYVLTEDCGLRTGHIGSGMIGVALLTLPITLPLSPLFFVVKRTYDCLENKWNMTKENHKIWSKLRKSPLFDELTLGIVKKALSKDANPFQGRVK
jgi:hypothetical protein